VGTAVGILALVVVLIGLFGSFAANYAIWQVVKDSRKRWRHASRDVRRRTIRLWIATALGAAAFLIVLIVAPFGPHTPLYAFAALGVLVILMATFAAATAAHADLKRAKAARAAREQRRP
jgi:archaellum biogenesis protein FlaJ (TadC family)